MIISRPIIGGDFMKNALIAVSIFIACALLFSFLSVRAIGIAMIVFSVIMLYKK